MEHLSSFLKMEIAKYKDIDHIFAKLEQDGEIEKINGLFRNIFENESEFTIGELIKIEQEKGEKMSIKEQYKNNLSLFKSNLVLIVQMIVENAFKSVVKETNQRLKADKNQAPAQEDDNEIDATNEVEESKPKTTKSDKKSKTKTTKRPKSQLQVNNSASNLSLNGEKKGYEPGKKSSISNLSTSKINSPLNQILHSPTSRSNNQSLRLDGNKSMTKDYSHSSIKNYSNISILSNRNPNNLSVQSEFNHITGSASFAQSKRGLWEHQPQSPGPAAYNTEKSTPSKLRRSPSPTIGKAPRGSWLDTCARTESPGPGGLYPSMHFIKK